MVAWLNCRRTSYKPHRIQWQDVEEEAKTGKLYVAEAADKDGRPVVVMRPRYSVQCAGKHLDMGTALTTGCSGRPQDLEVQTDKSSHMWQERELAQYRAANQVSGIPPGTCKQKS